MSIDPMRVQFGWSIGMPLVRSLKDDLMEVRSNLAETLAVLHAFIKRHKDVSC
jgi:hypothetical protein